LHFVIKGTKAAATSGEKPSKALLNPYALSKDFSIYHLSVKSTDSLKAAAYTVVYSSGLR